jgi:hypothetical protein
MQSLHLHAIILTHWGRLNTKASTRMIAPKVIADFDVFVRISSRHRSDVVVGRMGLNNHRKHHKSTPTCRIIQGSKVTSFC